MMDAEQFRQLVVKPTLTDMTMWSQSAENLLVGTALVESDLTYIRQHGGGPAVGFFQMEPATASDIANRYLSTRPDLTENVEAAVNVLTPHQINWGSLSDDALALKLTTDMRFACALARLKYWMSPEALPAADDIQGLAAVWKQVYNTAGGAGNVADFVAKYTAGIGQVSGA